MNDHHKAVRGTPPAIDAVARAQRQTPLVADGEILSTLTVSRLQAELDRLASLIGIDTQKALKFKNLSGKIENATKLVSRLDTQIKKAEGADNKIQELIKRRKQAYTNVFSAVVMLEQELDRLYAPLEQRLLGSAGPLGRFKFVVRRSVDLESWAASGEALLDLRRDGPFRGRGALLDTVRKDLLETWLKGTPTEVSAAMRDFMFKNEDAIRSHKRDGISSRDWGTSISKWLHSTGHVAVTYGLQYDGVDIERLSPGTRGIVLLLIYLAIDQEDDRPLIIDQPEENLDPQSIFDELVPRFREAKTRRQVIVVTHNANLVVNADADQVIVANAGEHKPGELPDITYESGGLEDTAIRTRVCNILEGGERAFQARARRLRIELLGQHGPSREN